MAYNQTDFPAGVIVFYRQITDLIVNDKTQKGLASTPLPTARQVQLNPQDDYTIFGDVREDGTREVLGIFPQEWVAAILPIITVGPGNANQS